MITYKWCIKTFTWGFIITKIWSITKISNKNFRRLTIQVEHFFFELKLWLPLQLCWYKKIKLQYVCSFIATLTLLKKPVYKCVYNPHSELLFAKQCYIPCAQSMPHLPGFSKVIEFCWFIGLVAFFLKGEGGW